MVDKNKINPSYPRNILDNLSTAVVLLNSDLNIEYINPASENLFQISKKQATGAYLNKIMNIDSRFIERLQDSIKNFHPVTEHEASISLPHGRKIIIDYHWGLYMLLPIYVVAFV